MSQTIGTQSIQFDEAPYILGSASIVGTKEGEGPLGALFDLVGEDDKFGEDTWEEAESTLQKEAASMAIGKAGLQKEDIRYIFGGDLLGQNIATTFGLMELNIPLFGLYGACSTAGESLSLAAMAVAAGYGEQALAVTSSHFASAEKQFRFPLEYANQRPLSATWTVTGSGAFILGRKRTHIRITGITTGKVVDYGIKDSMNMGAAMAPAACDTISQNLMDFNRRPEDYDKIITGDLGTVGQEILIDLMKKKGFDISSMHMDCGRNSHGTCCKTSHENPNESIRIHRFFNAFPQGIAKAQQRNAGPGSCKLLKRLIKLQGSQNCSAAHQKDHNPSRKHLRLFH